MCTGWSLNILYQLCWGITNIHKIYILKIQFDEFWHVYTYGTIITIKIIHPSLFLLLSPNNHWMVNVTIDLFTFLKIYICGITQCIHFYLASFTHIITLIFIHVVACINSSFFGTAMCINLLGYTMDCLFL